MRGPEAKLVGRLADARGNRVVFLSHCLLNENVRYLGGAFHRGAVPETVELIRAGVGICQMPCPEQHAWGGVHKRMLLRAYGLRDSGLYPFRRPLFWLFRLYTRARYELLARAVVSQIEQYRDAGVEVVSVVGVGASPSCGVTSTLDMKRSFDTAASCPLYAIDRTLVNERVVTGCRVPGEGLFVHALRRRLKRCGVDVPMLEYDLIAEMHGAPQQPFPTCPATDGWPRPARR